MRWIEKERGVPSRSRRRPLCTLVIGGLWLVLIPEFCQARSAAEEWASYSDARLGEIAAQAEVHSRDAAPQISLGLRRLWSNDLEGAATAFRTAILRDDSAAPAHLFLAMALNLQGIEYAANHYGSADIGPGTPAASTLANLFADADLHFETALTLQPDDPYAWLTWANAVFQRGRDNPLSLPVRNPTPALTKYRQALELDPNHRAARTALADALFGYGVTFRYVWLDHRDPGEAIAWLPEDIDAQAREYLAEAAEIYTALISQFPNDESLYGPAINTFEAAGQFDQMIALCKLAIDRFPQTRTARAAYRRWGLVVDTQGPNDSQLAIIQRMEYDDYGTRLGR